MGMNATWDLIGTLAPAVPYLERVVQQIEGSFDIKASTKHTLPSRDQDLAGLARIHADGEILEYREGRTDKGTGAKDVFTLGSVDIQDGSYLDDLFQDRWNYIQHASTKQDYSQPQDGSTTENTECISLETRMGSGTLERVEGFQERDMLTVDADWVAEIQV
jgi:hypothetical protein